MLPLKFFIPIVAILFAAGCSTPEQPRPNIIFVMSDDHAVNAVSAYGSKIIQTPNIDRLAARGMRFTNTYCTNSICGPSRATILTGQYSHKHGFMLNETTTFDTSLITFPKLLQKSGYKTAMIGKWHLGSLPSGFDDYNILVNQGKYFDPVFIENGDTVEYSGYVTDIITDLVIEWLSNSADEPFCLLYHHKAPHANFQPPPIYNTWLDSIQIPEPENLFDNYGTRTDAARDNEMRIDPHILLQYGKSQTPDIPEDLNRNFTQGPFSIADQLRRQPPQGISRGKRPYKRPDIGSMFGGLQIGQEERPLEGGRQEILRRLMSRYRR